MAGRNYRSDPPPAGTDPELAEWLRRQFSRIQLSSNEVVIYQDGGREDLDGTQADLDAHIQNKTDPHETIVPWVIDPASFDWYPGTSPGGDAGIGTLEKPVAHVALGTQEAVGVSGMEGLIADNSGATGGLLVVGLRDVDPANPPDPVVENAPISIFASPITLGSQVFVEVPQAFAEDHEVLFGPTQEIGGRHYSPLQLGPEKVYSQTEEDTDSADYDVLLIGGEVEIVSLTLVNAYVVGAVFSFQVYLENLGNKTTDFAVILKLNGVEQVRYNRAYNSSGALVQDSFPVNIAANIGDILSLDVEAVGTHGNSQGWVRGTNQSTVIRIQQG